MTLTRTSAKGYFLANLKPTQAQFSELFEGITFQQGTSAQFVESNVSALGFWDFKKDVTVSGKTTTGALSITGAFSANNLNTVSINTSALTVTGLTTLSSATGITQPNTDSSTNLATTAFANPLTSAALRGFAKLPGGVLLQWGNESGNSSPSHAITFPTPFTTTCYVVNANVNTTVNVSAISIDGNSVSAGGFTAYTNAGGFGFYWHAIGK